MWNQENHCRIQSIYESITMALQSKSSSDLSKLYPPILSSLIIIDFVIHSNCFPLFLTTFPHLFLGLFFLFSKPTVKRPLGRPIHRWEDNIRIDLEEVGIPKRLFPVGLPAKILKALLSSSILAT